MIRMRRCFPALFTLFIQGNLVWSLCTEENVQIEGGAYALSNGLKQGSVLKYRCDKGFYPHPDPVRVCHHDDTWEPAPGRSTCRRVECPDPAVLENCYVFPSEPRYFYQNQITYQCHEGFRLDGPTNRTCLSSGKWSGRHPVCHQDAGDHCLDPGVPPGGSRTGSIFDIGETVRYSCYGHSTVLIGSEKRVCREDGLWSGTEPTCYYPYTFNSPLEVSQEFGGGIKNTLVSLGTETNSTQEGRKIKLTTSGKLNIYIAVDVSMSIDQADFEMAKEAVITLIEKIAPFSVTPKYEIVFFASEALELINILTYAEPLAELVNRLKTHSIKAQDKFGTNLNVVFEKFLEKIAIIKQREGADFEKFHHAIIIFTDGHYNRGRIPTETVQQIKSTVLMNNTKREEHLDIYAFGIGKTINDGVLQSLTFGTGGRHYFRLESLEKLHETFDEIIDKEDVRGLCGLHRDTGEEDEDMDDETKREKYPWLLSVSVTHNMKTSTCLGSLVSHRFVLTAAHCIKVDKFFDNNVQVDVYKGKETLAVKGFHKHPKFNISAKADQGVQEFYDYDVALIELTKDVDISFSLRPICLPCTEQTNGALRQNYTCEEQERQLIKDKEEIHFLRNKHLVGKEAHLKLGESREDCILKARNVPGITSENVSVVVTENFLCSGGFEPYHDHITCKGDSGGAVFTNQRRRTIQVAVVSWGNKLMKQCKSDDDDDFRSDEDSRDFHFNLFRVLPFLRGILGKPGQGYAPLVFV